MTEEIVLAHWQPTTDKQLGKYSETTPYSITDAKLFLMSDELANPDKDVVTYCILTLRYMVPRSINMERSRRIIEINANLKGKTLCYHSIPILCAANVDAVAAELAKLAAKWWIDNG